MNVVVERQLTSPNNERRPLGVHLQANAKHKNSTSRHNAPLPPNNVTHRIREKSPKESARRENRNLGGGQDHDRG